MMDMAGVAGVAAARAVAVAMGTAGGISSKPPDSRLRGSDSFLTFYGFVKYG